MMALLSSEFAVQLCISISIDTSSSDSSYLDAMLPLKSILVAGVSRVGSLLSYVLMVHSDIKVLKDSSFSSPLLVLVLVIIIAIVVVIIAVTVVVVMMVV